MKIIVLAGGEANRLWPLNAPPKQFSPLLGVETLFQKTLKRFLKQYPAEDFVIVTQKKFLEMAILQAVEIEPALESRVIAEDKGQNTAPAILFALDWLDKREETPDLFLVTPSDHLIAPEQLLLEKITFAETFALEGSHILFGIFPTHPHTGYGYILCNTESEISPVDCFIEKPSLTKAKALLEEGSVLWNSGIFLFHRKTFLCANSPTSIDHALLEHAQNLKVIPLAISWSDVGSWDEVYEVFGKDAEKNVHIGNVIDINSKNCLVYGGKRLIATVDLEDLHIIDTDEALLITKKGSGQKVAKFSAMALSKTAK